MNHSEQQQQTWSWRRYARGVLHVTLTWGFLGIVVGVTTAPQQNGAIGLIAGAIAGVIVLSFYGILCGLIGGKPRETLVGAACGGATILAWALLLGNDDWGFPFATGVVTGSLIGGTFGPFFTLRKWVVKLIKAGSGTANSEEPAVDQATSIAG